MPQPYKSKGEFLEELERVIAEYERKDLESNESILRDYKLLSSKYQELKDERDGIRKRGDESKNADSYLICSGLKGNLYLIGGGLISLAVAGGLVELCIENKDSVLIGAPATLGALVLGYGGMTAALHGVIGIFVEVVSYPGNKLQKRKLGKIESKMQKVEQELHSEKYSGLEARLRK